MSAEQNKNITADSSEEQKVYLWFRDKPVTVREDRVVVKMFDQMHNFRKSIIMPTTYYPVEGQGTIRTFAYDNTVAIEDAKVNELLDGVEYKIGHCYENTKKVVDVLVKNGYNAKSYVGWLFVSSHQFPVHHCWCVIEDNIVIDLSDDLYSFFSIMNEEQLNPQTQVSSREAFVEFTKKVKNWPNSKRCFPLGMPNLTFFYVGCECDADEGRLLYQDLIRSFPDHECQRNVDGKGRNKLQQMLHAENLMP